MSIAPRQMFRLRERLILNGEMNFGFRIANLELAFTYDFEGPVEPQPNVLPAINPQSKIFQCLTL